MEPYFSAMSCNKDRSINHAVHDYDSGIDPLAMVFVPKIELGENIDQEDRRTSEEYNPERLKREAQDPVGNGELNKGGTSCENEKESRYFVGGSMEVNSGYNQASGVGDDSAPRSDKQRRGDCANRGGGGKTQTFTCEVCRKDFKWKGNLITHMHSHETGGGARNKHSCPICFKTFNWKSNLKTHLNKLHFGGSNEKHKCDLCAKEFNWKNSLTTHIQTVHSGVEQAHRCAVCGKSFNWKSNLNTHMESHTRVEKYPCEMCGKAFNWKSNLRAHMNGTHFFNGVLHTCAICQKNFSSKSSLGKHIETMHNDEVEKHSCTVCRKQFLWKSNLVTHMDMHEELKKHECGVCAKTFSWKSNLNKHMDTHRDNVAKFTCDVCYKKFSSKSSLNIHKDKHSEPKYSCPLCNKAFTWKSNYNAHVSKMHPERTGSRSEGVPAAHDRRDGAADDRIKSEPTVGGYRPNDDVFSALQLCGSVPGTSAPDAWRNRVTNDDAMVRHRSHGEIGSFPDERHAPRNPTAAGRHGTERSGFCESNAQMRLHQSPVIGLTAHPGYRDANESRTFLDAQPARNEIEAHQNRSHRIVPGFPESLGGLQNHHIQNLMMAPTKMHAEHRNSNFQSNARTQGEVQQTRIPNESGNSETRHHKVLHAVPNFPTARMHEAQSAQLIGTRNNGAHEVKMNE